MEADDPEGERAARHTRDVIEGRVLPDPELIARFEAMVRAERGKVHGMLLRMTGNAETAADLTQDALVTAFRKLPEWEGRASLSTWICSIAVNLALNHRRKRTEVLTEEGIVTAEDPSMSVLRTLSLQEREDLVRRASACLDPFEQEVVHLRFTEERSVDEITTELEIEGASGARGVLQRCRHRLEKEVRRLLEEMGHGATTFIRTNG